MENEEKAVMPVHKPDVKEKIFFFISGLLVSVPFTLFFSDFTDSLCIVLPMFFVEVCSTVLFAPLIEEFAKVFPLYYRHGETERSIMNLAVLTLGAPPISRVPGLIFHASSAGITAYGIAKKKPLRFYLVAVSLHFANNLFAVLGTSLLFFPGVAILIATFVLAWRLYQRTSKARVV
jgi:RsiW-degrading membrane proteinase PrsW (M82 family)